VGKTSSTPCCNGPVMPDPKPIEEWARLAKAYPRLENSVWDVPLKAVEWLDRHIMWRFGSRN
jgi:hypothetical protein